MAKKQTVKYKGFSFEDGRITDKAYVNGYLFGDRILEQVPFEIRVKANGTLQVRFAEIGPYEKGLNRKHWEAEALKFVQDNGDDELYFEKEDFTGEELQLVRA